MEAASNDMGRRAQHKPDELRELILDATHRIVLDRGIGQLSAREIARAIGYAPGTLYNMYHNLDEILLRVQVRMLEQLDRKLAHEMEGSSGIEAVRTYAAGYVTFAHKQPRLWSLLSEHNLPGDVEPPAWFAAAMTAQKTRLELPLAAIMGTKDAKAFGHAAGTLWAVIHAMTSRSINSKLGRLDVDTAMLQVTDVVDAYLQGLANRSARRSATTRLRETSTAAR